MDIKKNMFECSLLPSLERITAVYAAASLWAQEDIQSELCSSFSQCPVNEKYYNRIELKVLKNLLRLQLSKFVEEMVRHAVHHVGIEVMRWIEFSHYYLNKNERYLVLQIPRLCWNFNGIINYSKTAEVLGKDYSDLIVDKNLLDIESHDDTFLNINTKKLYWLSRLQPGEVLTTAIVEQFNQPQEQPYSIYESLFYWMVKCGIKEGVRYFWHKLSPEEKQGNIVEATKLAADLENANVLCFLLSQMNREQQDELFKTHHCSILCNLMKWPWMDFVIPTALLIWDVISYKPYHFIMKKIADDLLKYRRYIMMLGQGHIDNQMHTAIFRELWKCSPISLKKCLLNDGVKVIHILETFLYMEDSETFTLILSDADSERKKELIYSSKGFCCDLISQGKYNFINIFLYKTLNSREDIHCFQELLIRNYGFDIFHLILKLGKLEVAGQFVNWSSNIMNQPDSFLKHFNVGALYECIKYNEVDFLKLDNLLASIFSQEELSAFKKRLHYDHSFLSVLHFLICADKYEKIDNCLKWCFANEEDLVLKYKSHLFFSSCRRVNFLLLLVNKRDELATLYKFVNWSISEEEQSKHRETLQMKDDCSDLCSLLLLGKKSEFLQELQKCILPPISGLTVNKP